MAIPDKIPPEAIVQLEVRFREYLPDGPCTGSQHSNPPNGPFQIIQETNAALQEDGQQPAREIPRCQAYIVYAGYRGRNKKYGDKCGNYAKVTIEGCDFCIRHAQQAALELLIRKYRER